MPMTHEKRHPGAVAAAEASERFGLGAERPVVNPLPPNYQAPIVGIDPGGHGAFVGLAESGEILWHEDMPTTPEANGRVATNVALLAARLAKTHARVAYCEFVSARPTDAKAAAFSFGRARGCIEGVCAALSIPIVFLTPPTSKRLPNIPPGAENKDLARTRAIARWPAHAGLFSRKKDIERAEVALIGLGGLLREGRT
jgi:crossover junction endodeoxyribonuclease RuvC